MNQCRCRTLCNCVVSGRTHCHYCRFGMGEQDVREKVYLCGGINGLSDADCKDWREVAKANLTMETLDPMRRDYRGIEADSVNDIVRGDLADIEECTTVLVNATKPSWGTAMEVVYARKAGKRVVAFTGEARISPWLTLSLHEDYENYRRSDSSGLPQSIQQPLLLTY